MMYRPFILLVALLAASCAAPAPTEAVTQVPSAPFTCLIAGDSINSVPYGLGAEFPKCKTDAKVGDPSVKIIPRVHAGYTVTVISAGSNDVDNPKLLENLRAMRAKVTGRYIWVEPRAVKAAIAVALVASENGDAILPFKPGKDNVHPQNYKAMASDLRQIEPRL